MKKFTKFIPFMAVAMMVGCAKDQDLSVAPNHADDVDGGAYVAVTMSTPGTRSNADDVEGTEAESAVDNIKLIIFDKDYNYISVAQSNQPVKPNVYEFEVAPNAYRFFAIVNPTDAMNTAIDGISGNWNTVEMALQTVISLEARGDINKYTTANMFPMVNAGSLSNNIESILAKPTDSELVNGKLSTDKNDPTEIVINVDRMVAKFTAIADNSTLKVSDDRTETGVVQNPAPVGSIDGVRLNVINKKSYIYSHINKVNKYGDDYRTDPNMSVPACEALPKDEETELTKNFFWLHNYENPVFKAPAAVGGTEFTTEYVFENTANGENFDYNNLTQLVVKATYIPTGQTDPDNLPAGNNFTTELTHDALDGGSWFSIKVDKFGTMQMTFAGVKGYYEAIKLGGATFAQDTERCDAMDAQLRHMLKSATDLNGITDIDNTTWSDPAVTCAVLNSIPNGGYVAATVADEKNCVIQFFQKGVNYYDIFIQHDADEEIANLGRWGMVRNNHYTLTINSISGPGLPYIPDPTDPEIKDPQNPDPKDPDPADEEMAHIQATINVNWWTMWTQDVNLN